MRRAQIARSGQTEIYPQSKIPAIMFRFKKTTFAMLAGHALNMFFSIDVVVVVCSIRLSHTKDVPKEYVGFLVVVVVVVGLGDHERKIFLEKYCRFFVCLFVCCCCLFVFFLLFCLFVYLLFFFCHFGEGGFMGKGGGGG